jgi:hypothetical protein
VVMVAV